MNRALDRFVPLLNKLDADTKPSWGIMTPQHMVEHLILSMQMSTNKLGELKTFNPPEKLPVLRRVLMSERPLPKGFINPYIGKGLVDLKFDNLSQAVDELKKEVEDYYSFFEIDKSKITVNVTFGELNFDEWEVFHTKHFTHHLTQFGIKIE